MRFLTLLVILILPSCGRADLPFVEQHLITTGSFNGLTIGMQHAEVLTAAKQLGAKLISPIPCNPFAVSQRNLAEMPLFQGLEGIEITDARGGFVAVYFSGTTVSSVLRSPGANSLPSIPLGETIQSTRDSLMSDLRGNPNLSVTPIVNHGEVDVLTLEDIPKAAEKMRAHQCWMFEVNSVKPAGATYALTFGPTGLEKILYRRARIRAD